MNPDDKKVSLEIPLNTQMKIFAFLFKENYSMSELFSGVREVGYYGESRSFSINTNTNSLSLGITLKAASGNEDDSTGTGAGTGDTTAPTASVTTATITNSGNAVVQSTETGTAYLVNTAVTVSNLASITGAADSQWNSVAISSANTNTNLAATGLVDGTYKVYAVDAAGNLSSASTNSVTLETTAPTVSSVSTTADNQSSVSITDIITVTFSEAMHTSYITADESTGCEASIQVSSDNFSSCVKMSSEPASSNSNKTFTLDPYDNLTVSTTYKTRVTTGVKDTAGNALNSQYETPSGFTTATPIVFTATAIAAGSLHTCALLDNASVKCWGYNNHGQLGIDNTTHMGGYSGDMAVLPTVNLGTGRTATAIAVGSVHTCALLDNASVKCWGYNNLVSLVLIITLLWVIAQERWLPYLLFIFRKCFTN